MVFGNYYFHYSTCLIKLKYGKKTQKRQFAKKSSQPVSESHKDISMTSNSDYPDATPANDIEISNKANQKEAGYSSYEIMLPNDTTYEYCH